LADFHQASRSVPPDYTNHIRYFFGLRQRFLEKMYRKLHGWRKTSSQPIELAQLDFALHRLDQAYSYIKDVPVDSIAHTAVWCHGGLQHRNIMLDHQDQVWLIDFETLTFMERVADLAQFLQYHGFKYGWAPSAVQIFLDAYNDRLDVPISMEERKWFLSYLTFTKRMASRLNRYFGNRNRTPKDFIKCKETLDKEFKKEGVLLQVHKQLLK
jgi:thiamine kinase-like enzyme